MSTMPMIYIISQYMQKCLFDATNIVKKVIEVSMCIMTME